MRNMVHRFLIFQVNNIVVDTLNRLPTMDEISNKNSFPNDVLKVVRTIGAEYI